MLEARATLGAPAIHGADWFVDHQDSPVARVCAEVGIEPPRTTGVALRVVADRAGVLGTGALGFLFRTQAATFGTRMNVRSALAGSARKADRLDDFLGKDDPGAAGLSLLTALGGAACAEPRGVPSSVFAPAREIVLQRRPVTAIAGGWTAFAAVLAERAGPVRTKAPVARILAEGGRALGVRLEDGDEVRGSAVIAATGAEALRALFAPEDWESIPWEARLRIEACAARPGVRVRFEPASPAPEAWLAFVAQPPGWLLSLPPAGDGTEGVLVGHAGLPVGTTLDEETIERAASALARAAARLVPGFDATGVARRADPRPHDDPAFALAGGRDRPHHALDGFENVFLAGEHTDSPHRVGLRAVASGREAATLAAPR